MTTELNSVVCSQTRYSEIQPTFSTYLLTIPYFLFLPNTKFCSELNVHFKNTTLLKMNFIPSQPKLTLTQQVSMTTPTTLSHHWVWVDIVEYTSTHTQEVVMATASLKAIARCSQGEEVKGA